MSDTGFRCEDVERLTFPDGSFDIVISEDVFEHVSDPMRGFAEIHRVLKPGGRHIFTIPYYRQRAKTAARAARTDGGIVHYDRPEYHGDPFNRDGALVYTDFGQDIADMLRAIGFEVDIAAIHDPRFANSWNEVFITRKPPA
jgi:SAM-dependent methyltransferase